MASTENNDAAANGDDWGVVTATDKDWEAAIAKASQETPVALPRIKFPGQNCVVILTDSNGKPAAIGSLKPSESPACIIRFARLHENRETSLSLLACFPKAASGNNPMNKEFQRIQFKFYGDAFETFKSDFVISEVKELKELPSILADRKFMLGGVGQDLHKIHLKYQPEKVVTKAKNDPESFAMPESSDLAHLFKSLLERGGPMTLNLYARITPGGVEALHAIRDRLEKEKDVQPFNEYRDKNGKIVIQWGTKFGPWLDVRSNLTSQLNFRTPEQHAVTLAYGEMRDHAFTAEMAISMLTKPVTISFVAAPGYTNKKNVTSKYVGIVDISDSEVVGQLFQIGSTATLCFKQPKTTVEPQGWHCDVKPDIGNAEYPGNLVLLVTRGDEREIKAAKAPSFDMMAESDYSVWIYPHGSNKAAKRLVNCANKILHGEKDETPEHIAKRVDLQKFCSGLDFSSLPKPAQALFDRSKLSLQQRRALERIERRCSDDQRKALNEIYSCNSFVNMIQGPPGTGKTFFAAHILIPILAIFGMKANCYAASNAATDVLAGKIPKDLKALRFHGVGKEWNSLQQYDYIDEPTLPKDLKALRFHGVGKEWNSLQQYAYIDEPTPETPAQDAAAMSEDEIAWLQMYREVSSSRLWNVPPKMERPHIDSRSLYVRALQRAKVMDDDLYVSQTLPDGVPEEYQTWAQYYYDVVETGDEDEDDESFETYKRLTFELFEDTLKDTNFVVTTCSNAADVTLRRSTQPIIVIVDEAGVAKELETLMAIYHNLGSVLMVVFLGDPKQVPDVPSLRRKVDKNDPHSQPYNVFAPQLATSLMARQINNGMSYTKFTRQYRF